MSLVDQDKPDRKAASAVDLSHERVNYSLKDGIIIACRKAFVNPVFAPAADKKQQFFSKGD